MSALFTGEHMNELSLFTGIGGGLLGTRLLGWKPVCGVEKESYCREVLLRRQRDGLLPLFPVWDDVRTFDGRPWRGIVDVVTAGFPCQPFSVAGKRDGADDERNMWPETIRVIREVGPRFCLLENVPGLIRFDYFGQILGDLAEAGFDAEWDVVSAEDVGANHLRKRLWIVAYSAGLKTRAGLCGDRSTGSRRGQSSHGSGESGEVSDALRVEFEPGARGWGIREGDSKQHIDWWTTEPALGRVAHGVANRVDRLAAIGNGQVPAVVRAAWTLMKTGQCPLC